ncbi:hypothetical protein [Gloeobacter violaceus]|nr:hypothetical protein [Gloeobacter violaceus]
MPTLEAFFAVSITSADASSRSLTNNCSTMACDTGDDHTGSAPAKS